MPISQSGASCGLPPARMTRRSSGSSTGSLTRRTNRGQAPNGVMPPAPHGPVGQGHGRGVDQGGDDEDAGGEIEGGEKHGERTDDAQRPERSPTRIGRWAPERVVHMTVNRPPLSVASSRIWPSPRQDVISRRLGAAEADGDDRLAREVDQVRGRWSGSGCRRPSAGARRRAAPGGSRGSRSPDPPARTAPVPGFRRPARPAGSARRGFGLDRAEPRPSRRTPPPAPARARLRQRRGDINPSRIRG